MSISVWYSDGADAPRTAPRDVLALAGLDPGAEHAVTLGWTVERQTWIDDPSFRGRTMMAGYALAAAVNEGRVVAAPTRLSAVPAMIESAPPDVAVITGIRRGGDLVFTGSLGCADVLARQARRVVIEVAADSVDLGAPVIAGNVVATVPRPAATAARAIASRPADATDLHIGALVASLLPDEPTLEFGPGGIGEGIARALDRPVRIWSGLLTDPMADLASRGLLLDEAVAAYAWGGEAIHGLAMAGKLRLASTTETHDLTRLSAMPRFIGCNTALQVGLDGAVNVERVGGRVVAGVGGHADFCAGASRSPGGFALIAVRSTTSGGSSTIVSQVEVVTTPRADIDFVVTEHGVADLRGTTDEERASRLIAIAAPEHQQALRAAAKGSPR